jgi:hypothetical protein
VQNRRGMLCGAGLCALFLGHTGAGLWFVAHSELVEAEMVQRREYGFLRKRHGLTDMEVRFPNRHGVPKTEKIQWHLFRPDNSATVLIRRADSGLIRAAPAQLAEVFWLELWFSALALVVGIIFLAGRMGFRLVRRA